MITIKAKTVRALNKEKNVEEYCLSTQCYEEHWRTFPKQIFSEKNEIFFLFFSFFFFLAKPAAYGSSQARG